MFWTVTPSASITWMPLARVKPPSRITVLRSVPRIVRYGVVTVTASSYTPGDTSTMPPGFARSTAAWIVGACWGTRIVCAKPEGTGSSPGPTPPAGPGSGTSPTTTVPAIPTPGLP